MDYPRGPNPGTPSTTGVSGGMPDVYEDEERAEVQKDRQYKRYIASVDACLIQFDSVTEWAGVISFLTKLVRIIQQFSNYVTVPKKLTVSKRLAQCLNPALPSGVHQKTIEVYEQIFKNYGSSQKFVDDLPLWTYGIFPYMQSASMTNKPAVLDLYESYFFPLGQKLQPSTKGMLLGLLPNLDEDGNEFFDRTLNMIYELSSRVGPSYFSTCMWLALIDMPSYRFAGMNYLIRKMPKIRSEEDAVFILGGDKSLLLRALCVTLKDQNVLVQRCSLDLLLTHFPLDGIFKGEDQHELTMAALSVVLKRDMSLNRRLYTWLLNDGKILSKSTREVITGSFQYTLAQILDQYTINKNKLQSQLHNSHLGNSNGAHSGRGYDKSSAGNVDYDATSTPENMILDLLKTIIYIQDRGEVGPILIDDVLFITLNALYKIRRMGFFSGDLSQGFKQLLSSIQPYALFGRFCGALTHPSKYVTAAHTKSMDQYVLMSFAIEFSELKTDDIQIIHLPFFAYSLCNKIRSLYDETNKDTTMHYETLRTISSAMILLRDITSEISQDVSSLDVKLGEVLLRVVSITSTNGNNKSTSVNNDKLAVPKNGTNSGLHPKSLGSISSPRSPSIPAIPQDVLEEIEKYESMTTNWTLEQQVEWFYTFPETRMHLIYNYPQMNYQVGRQVTKDILDELLFIYTDTIRYSTDLPAHNETYKNKFLIQIMQNVGGATQKLFASISQNEHTNENKENEDADDDYEWDSCKTNAISTVDGLRSRKEFVLFVNTMAKACVDASNITVRLEIATHFLKLRSIRIITDDIIHDADTFISRLFGQLWNSIDPLRPVFHSWIIESIWSACKLYGVPTLERWLCESFNTSDMAQRAISYTRFGIFWKLSEDNEFDVSQLFSRPLFCIIESINCGNPHLERIARNWTKYNLKSTVPIVKPLVNILLDNAVTARKVSIDVSNDHLTCYVIDRPFSSEMITYSLNFANHLIELDEREEFGNIVDFGALMRTLPGNEKLLKSRLDSLRSIFSMVGMTLQNDSSSFIGILFTFALNYIKYLAPSQVLRGDMCSSHSNDDLVNAITDTSLEFQTSATELISTLIKTGKLDKLQIAYLQNAILEKLRVCIKLELTNCQLPLLDILSLISVHASSAISLDDADPFAGQITTSSIYGNSSSPTGYSMDAVRRKQHNLNKNERGRGYSRNRQTVVKSQSRSSSMSPLRNAAQAAPATEKLVSSPLFIRAFLEAIASYKCTSIVNIWLDLFLTYIPYCIIPHKKVVTPMVKAVIDTITKSGYCLNLYIKSTREMSSGSTLLVEKCLNGSKRKSRSELVRQDSTNNTSKNGSYEIPSVQEALFGEHYSDLNLQVYFNFLSNLIISIVGAESTLESGDIAVSTSVLYHGRAMPRESLRFLNLQPAPLTVAQDINSILVTQASVDTNYANQLHLLSDELLNLVPKIIYTAYRVYTIVSPESSSGRSSNAVYSGIGHLGLEGEFDERRKSLDDSLEQLTKVAHATTVVSHIDSNGNALYFANELEAIIVGFLSELREIAIVDLVGSFVDTFIKENSSVVKHRERKLKVGAFNLLGLVPRLSPQSIIEIVVNMLRQRVPSSTAKDTRVTANIIRLTDTSMLFFLDCFCNQVSDEVILYSTWSTFAGYARETLGHVSLYKHHFVPILKVLSTYLTKLDNFEMFEEKKLKRDAEDLYCRMVETVISLFNKVFESGSYNNVLDTNMPILPFNSPSVSEETSATPIDIQESDAEEKSYFPHKDTDAQFTTKGASFDPSQELPPISPNSKPPMAPSNQQNGERNNNIESPNSDKISPVIESAGIPIPKNNSQEDINMTVGTADSGSSGFSPSAALMLPVNVASNVTMAVASRAMAIVGFGSTNELADGAVDTDTRQNISSLSVDVGSQTYDQFNPNGILSTQGTFTDLDLEPTKKEHENNGNDSPVWATYERKTLSSSAGQLEKLSDSSLIIDTVNYFIMTLPRFGQFVGDEDRRAGIVTKFIYYLNLPLFKIKTRPFEEQLAQLLSAVAEHPNGCKTWKTICWDIFNDSEFFARGYFATRKYRPFFRVVFDIDSSKVKSDILTKISSNIVPTLFSSRENEILMKCLLIRRFSYVTVVSNRNSLVDNLPLVHEKLVDIIKSPPGQMHVEAFNCIRVLLVKVDYKHLTNIWPTVISLLVQLMSIPDPWVLEEKTPTLFNVFATACKLLDLILLLRTPDFQYYQWIFIEENDYRTSSFNGGKHAGLLDSLALRWKQHFSAKGDGLSAANTRLNNHGRITPTRSARDSTTSELEVDVQSGINNLSIDHAERTSRSHIGGSSTNGSNTSLNYDGQTNSSKKLLLSEVGLPTNSQLQEFMEKIGSHTFEVTCAKTPVDITDVARFIEKDIFSF